MTAQATDAEVMQHQIVGPSGIQIGSGGTGLASLGVALSSLSLSLEQPAKKMPAVPANSNGII